MFVHTSHSQRALLNDLGNCAGLDRDWDRDVPLLKELGSEKFGVGRVHWTDMRGMAIAEVRVNWLFDCLYRGVDRCVRAGWPSPRYV